MRDDKQSVMTIARDGGVAFRPGCDDDVKRAQDAGGAYSPVGGLWHWTGRHPYEEQEIPGLLLSRRPDEWVAESPDELAERLTPGRIVRAENEDRPVADQINEHGEADRVAMAIASARAMLLDPENRRVTAIFPDDSQIILALR